jgi:hypothetical protein
LDNSIIKYQYDKMDTIYLTKIKQHFSNNSLADVKGEVSKELSKLQTFIKPGANIALAIGSRGIKDLVLIVREVAEFIKANKANPFIIPAMGSHGGATAEGQEEILAGYGISEKNLGIPVRSSMEVVEMPHGDSPIPVYMDRNAYESDGVVLINRIKQHTDYHAIYESGMVKMSVIGLGKEKQASAIHEYGVYGLSVLIPMVAKEIFLSGKILGGIAIVENAFDETMLVKALVTNQFFTQEPALLEIATKNMSSLPADDIDLLIIDQLGKDISGVGIDPNIIGRTRITGQKEPDKPNIKAILVSDLTDATRGNAMGIGLSDVITRRLYEKIDFQATYTNIVTSSFLERGKIPIVADTDKEAFGIALRSCGYLKKGEEKIIRIKNTLHLDEVYISQAILKTVLDSKSIEIIKENVNLFESDTEFAPF